MKRREFFAALTAAGGAMAAQRAWPESPATVRGTRPHITWTLFSRHVQWVVTQAFADAKPYETGVLVGNKAQEIGFRAVDLTVRPTGLIDPTRVDVKLNLPRMVEGIRSTGAICDQITTNIETADKPIGAFNGRQVMPAEVLSVAGALGIGLYRWGGFTYEAGAATPFGDQVPAQLKAFSRKLASLAALNRKTRTTALYHTYSGGNNARSVWDLMAILAPYSANELAINFDIGHMTREGALSAWSTNLRYAMPRVKGLGLKDGSVTRTVDGNIVGAFPQAGAGLVRWVEFFKLLREGGFSGPGGAQYEYDVIGVKGAPAALSTTFWADHPQFQSGNLTAPFMTAEMKKDLSYYRAHAVMAGWREDELS